MQVATHLNLSLEKLDVSFTIDSTAILQLRSVGTLKVLICFNFEDDDGENYEVSEELKSLRKNLPQVSINEERFYIATSTRNEKRREYENGFWKLKLKRRNRSRNDFI